MSGFLLDTNCISELVRAKPDRRVMEWMDAADESLLYLSVLTLAEVRHERGQNPAKSLGINLGNGRVCTTFAIEFEPLGEAEAELLEERFLLGGRFGDAA